MTLSFDLLWVRLQQMPWVEISSDGTSVRGWQRYKQDQTYQTAKKRIELEELEKTVHL